LERVNNRLRLLSGLLVVLVVFWVVTGLQAGQGRLRYDEFVEAVEAGRVESVVIGGQSLDGEFTDGESFSTTLPGTTLSTRPASTASTNSS